MTTPNEVVKYEPQQSDRETRMREGAMNVVFDDPHPHWEVYLYERRDPDIRINEIERYFPENAQPTKGPLGLHGVREKVGRLVEFLDQGNHDLGMDRSRRFYRGAHDLSRRYQQYPVGFCDQVAATHLDCVTVIDGVALSNMQAQSQNRRVKMPSYVTSEYIFGPAGSGTLKLIARATPTSEVAGEVSDVNAQYRCIDLDALYAIDSVQVQKYFTDVHELYAAYSVLNHLGHAYHLDSARDEELIPKELRDTVLDKRHRASLNTVAYFIRSRSSRSETSDLSAPISSTVVGLMREGVESRLVNQFDDKSPLTINTPAYLQHRIKYGSLHPNSLNQDQYNELEEFMFVLDDVTDTSSLRHMHRDAQATLISRAVKNAANDDEYRTRLMYLSYQLINPDESVSKAGQVHKEAYADFKFIKAITAKSLEVIAGETNHPMHGHPLTQLYRDLVAVDDGAELQRILRDLRKKRTDPAPDKYRWEPGSWLSADKKPPNEFAETVQLKGSPADEQLKGFNARLHADHKLWKAFADALRIEEINQFKIARLVPYLFAGKTSSEKKEQVKKEGVAADAAVNDIVTSYEKKSRLSAEYQAWLKRSLVQARTYLQGLGVTVEDLKAAHQFASQSAETTGNEPRKRTSSSHMNEAVLFLLDAAAWKKAVGLDMANPVFRQVAAMYHFPPDFWDRFQPKQRRLRGPIYRGKRSISKQ